MLAIWPNHCQNYIAALPYPKLATTLMTLVIQPFVRNRFHLDSVQDFLYTDTETRPRCYRVLLPTDTAELPTLMDMFHNLLPHNIQLTHFYLVTTIIRTTAYC